MASFNINGKTYSGNNISINDDHIIIDGRSVLTGSDKVINIAIVGDVSSLQVDVCEKIGVKGSVGTVKTQSGNVECGNVSGSVKTMSGNVECGTVEGSVSTMSGNIKRK